MKEKKYDRLCHYVCHHAGRVQWWAALTLKLPVGVSMMIAALCGAIQGGLGVETLRMMVEGEFGYVDTILTIGCAMIS